MADNYPPNIYPCLRYKDAHAAIDWLERAFGFKRHAVHEAPDGSIFHTQMFYGAGMIMLGATQDDFIKQAGVGPQSIYVAVTDPDTHHAQAKAAGARVVRALNDTDYGSREYCALDLEGHFWSFGTYWPKASDPA
ncbi:MAG: hypothetical protein FJX60_03545 [Alphaproteobacteria bacterium]|nr:hypothetical protein [Alphaproteobacteria bacterium]